MEESWKMDSINPWTGDMAKDPGDRKNLRWFADKCLFRCAPGGMGVGTVYTHAHVPSSLERVVGMGVGGRLEKNTRSCCQTI